ITVDQIHEKLTVNGGPQGNNAADILNVDDSEDGNNNLGTLTATTITGLDMAGSIEYHGFEALNVKLRHGNDELDVLRTAAGMAVDLNGGPGNDYYFVQIGSLVSAPLIDDTGTGDNDSALVNGTAVAETFEVNRLVSHRVYVGNQVVNYTDTLENMGVDGQQ